VLSSRLPPAWLLPADRRTTEKTAKTENCARVSDQRHRALWSEPDRFDPGRWLAAEPPPAMAERLAMIPFGYGPRVCPGKRFAEVEMQAILFELLGSCHVARRRGRAPNPLGTLTSRPDYDFCLQITPRGPG
jgi:cytochrome P450